MRKLWNNNHADLGMIMTSIIMAIGFAMALLVIFSILGGLSPGDVDGKVAEAIGYRSGTDSYNGTTPVTNATGDLQTNVETFFTVGPIALIVIAAIGILGYVLLLRRK